MIKVRILRSVHVDTKAIGLEGAPYTGQVGAVIEFASKESLDAWVAKAAPSSYEVIKEEAIKERVSHKVHSKYSKGKG
jgi:hypothetical protein